MAYILALWSFVVLFMEPVIGFYLDFGKVESYTALANIVLLVFTILNRFWTDDLKENRNIIIFDLAMLLLGAMLLNYQAKFAIFFLLIRQLYFILQFLIFRAFEGKLYKFLASNPPTTLMISFLAVIGIGTLLLMLPAASAQNRVTPFTNALFTSTSATCVTGLIVYDTGTYWSTFGQMIILVLIQIGGLGIMTISTAFALMLGQRLTLKLQNIMHNVVGGSGSVNLFQLLKNIILVTVLIEALGAAMLFVPFLEHHEPLRALYLAAFHSVSAFCNAGFSLMPDSFSAYVTNPMVNVSITSLVIIGGLGFTVIIDIYRNLFSRDKIKRFSLHSKIVLSISALLLVWGFVTYFITEYYHSMEGFDTVSRIWASWFQSVTTRTAGFNTIDVSKLGSASVLITYLLMFIGASPGSTGGGIKTTTFGVLILSVSSMLQGRKDLSIFNRKIADSNFRESASLITITVFILFSVILVLMLVEPLPFDKLVFEAISAFGTVGLSMGITDKLSGAGKLLITLLMYIGRIGPLTMIYALAIRKQHSGIDYAEEKLAIG